MKNNEEIEHWIEKNKKKVKDYIVKNNYYSVMNNTKWNELINAVRNELRFKPPYILKTLFEEEKEFVEILKRFNIPFEYGEGVYTIYGYKRN